MILLIVIVIEVLMAELLIKSRENMKRTIVLFHGYGKNWDIFASVGRAFSRAITDADIHIPNAFQECAEGGYQWFPFIDENVESWKTAYYDVEPQLEEYVANIVQEKKQTYDDVTFVGFSQGAMISIMLGIKLQVKAAIAFAGQLLDPNISVNSNQPKIFMAHSKMDKVVPISEMYSAEKILQSKGLTVKTFISKATEHVVDIDMIKASDDFLLEQNSH